MGADKKNKNGAKITDPVQDVGSNKAVGSNIRRVRFSENNTIFNIENANNKINIEDSSSRDRSRHKVENLMSQDLNGSEEAYLRDPIPELMPELEELRPIDIIPLPTRAAKKAALHLPLIDEKEPRARSTIPQPVPEPDPVPRSQVPKPYDPTARTKTSQLHNNSDHMPRSQASKPHDHNQDLAPRSHVPQPYFSGTAYSKATDRVLASNNQLPKSTDKALAGESKLPNGPVAATVINKLEEYKLKDLRKAESVRVADKATSSNSTARSNPPASSANFSSIAKKKARTLKPVATAANKPTSLKHSAKVNPMSDNQTILKHAAKANSTAYKPILKKPVSKKNTVPVPSTPVIRSTRANELRKKATEEKMKITKKLIIKILS